MRYSLNHPDTQVFNQDCNDFLSHAISHSLLEGLNGRLHQLPQPGDVDIIFGGIFHIHCFAPNPELSLQVPPAKHLVERQ